MLTSKASFKPWASQSVSGSFWGERMNGSFSGASTGSHAPWRHCNAKGSTYEWVSCQAFANRNKRDSICAWLTARISLVLIPIMKLANCHCQRNCGVLQLGSWQLAANAAQQTTGHRPTLPTLHPSCAPHYPLLPLVQCLCQRSTDGYVIFPACSIDEAQQFSSSSQHGSSVLVSAVHGPTYLRPLVEAS